MQARSTGTVLIVDDEPMVATALRSFLELETSYQVHAFTSPQEALGCLETTPVDVVIADFMMPGMDGIKFLTEARGLRPEASRVLLTGYADKENAIRAINDVGLYYYMEKPWDNDLLTLVIRNGIERASLLRDLNVKIGALASANQDLSEIRQRLIRALL